MARSTKPQTRVFSAVSDSGRVAFPEQVRGGVHFGTALVVSDARQQRKTAVDGRVPVETGDIILDVTRNGELVAINCWRVEGIGINPEGEPQLSALLVDAQRHANFVPQWFDGVVAQAVMETRAMRAS